MAAALATPNISKFINTSRRILGLAIHRNAELLDPLQVSKEKIPTTELETPALASFMKSKRCDGVYATCPFHRKPAAASIAAASSRSNPSTSRRLKENPSVASCTPRPLR